MLEIGSKQAKKVMAEDRLSILYDILHLLEAAADVINRHQDHHPDAPDILNTILDNMLRTISMDNNRMTRADVAYCLHHLAHMIER